LEQIPNDETLNINGFVPSNETGLEYADAYKQLLEGLNLFSQQAGQDKKILSQINIIKRTIDADSKVTPANKEIQQAKTIADNIIRQKRNELEDIVDQVKDYDQFVSDLEKNQIQLVSEKEHIKTTISTPLIKIKESTRQLIAQQEAPDKTYLALNKDLVN